MIKKLKYLLTLFVIGLGIINISFGNFDGITYYNTFDLGLEKDIGDSTQNYFELMNNGNFLINGTYNYLSVNYITNVNRIYNVFWTSEGLYLLNSYYDNLTTPKVQGYFKNFCKRNISEISFNSNNYCYDNVDYYQYRIDDFFINDDYKYPDKLYVYGGYGNEFSICFIYTDDNFGVCTYYNGSNSSNIQSTLSGSLDLGYNPTTPEYYSQSSFGDYITYSLLGGGNGGDNGEGGEGGETENQIPGISPGSVESAINYFEKRYGRNESICYVGIDNITTMYGSSVSFEQGTGLNIFEVYSGLYNNSDLDKVYVWLNTRLINYEQWFLRDSPLYLASYNSGTNKVNLYYENLTFPFANNPVALYFMASNITDYSEGSTMGSEVVSYCNIKINGGTFDEIIDNSTKNNIINYTEQSNKNDGLNPDGTPNVIIYNNFNSYTGDAWLSSGVDIAFSGNTSLQNTLKNFFDRFDNAFDNINLVTTNRILPSYLVTAFLFVVLFKFLRKRK